MLHEDSDSVGAEHVLFSNMILSIVGKKTVTSLKQRSSGSLRVVVLLGACRGAVIVILSSAPSNDSDGSILTFD